jgi:hypothetical protein
MHCVVELVCWFIRELNRDQQIPVIRHDAHAVFETLFDVMSTGYPTFSAIYDCTLKRWLSSEKIEIWQLRRKIFNYIFAVLHSIRAR